MDSHINNFQKDGLRRLKKRRQDPEIQYGFSVRTSIDGLITFPVQTRSLVEEGKKTEDRSCV